MPVRVRPFVVLLGLALGLAPAAPGELAHAGGRQLQRVPAIRIPGGLGQKPRKPRQRRADARAQAEHQLAEVRETVYQSREISAHESILGTRFFRSLRRLRKGDHWIEIGPSSDAHMALSYLFDTAAVEPFRFGREKARVTGIGLEALDPTIARGLGPAMRKRGVRYEHRAGRFLEDYEPGEIELASVVSDQYSAFSYTHRPQKILEIEGSLLVEGGMLHTHSSPMTRVIDRRGNDVFIDWLKATKGLELVEHSEKRIGEMVLHQVQLRRTEGSVRAPALRMTRFEAGHPPTREFVWDGRPARAERTRVRRASP